MVADMMMMVDSLAELPTIVGTKQARKDLTDNAYTVYSRATGADVDDDAHTACPVLVAPKLVHPTMSYVILGVYGPQSTQSLPYAQLPASSHSPDASSRPMHRHG